MDWIILGKDVDTDEEVKLRVPELLTGRTAVIAKTGYGKSWTIRRIAEQLLEKGYPLGILDPEGEHVSLADRYEMLIISPEGDVDLRKASLRKLVKMSVEGVSFVLDMSKYQPEEATSLAAKLMQELMNTGAKGFLVIVDEARELAPERGARSVFGEHAELTSTWLTTLATRGRKRGVGLLFSTQRPQLVSKTLISQVENKVILRVEYNADISVIAKFLGLDRETVRRIRKLDKGIAYVEGPFVDRPRFVKVGEVKTKHRGETPSPIPRPPPSLDEVVRYIMEPDLVEEHEIAEELGAEDEEAMKVISQGKTVLQGGTKGKEGLRERIRLEDVWSMPSSRLTSRPVKELVSKRNYYRALLKRLEERRGEVKESVYEILKKQYEDELNSLEERLEPYVREAEESLLLIEAAIEDRKNRLLILQEETGVKRIRNAVKILKLKREIKSLQDKRERLMKILRSLKGKPD